MGAESRSHTLHVLDNTRMDEIRRTFGWKRKIVLQKEDGTEEVTIEIPAKHEKMKGSTMEDLTNINAKENPDEEPSTSDNTSAVQQIRVADNSKQIFKENENDIPVLVQHFSGKSVAPSAYVPEAIDIFDSLSEEIGAFEKEYKEVKEIIKRDHLKKSIAILMENSKSY